MSELLTTGEVSKLTGFSVLKVRTLVEQGKIPAVNTSCGTRPRWSIRRCDLEAYLSTPTNTPHAPRPTATRRRRIDADVPQVF